jgi:2-polyprenyl-3-methyl-5-hydroxy-6-metoxy-1,4-benzoquinol methylase
VLGIDADADEIRLGQAFAASLGVQPALKCMDIGNHDWLSQVEAELGGKPETVVLAYALHHFRDPASLVRQLQGYLEPGSMVVVNEEDLGSWLFRIKHSLRTWIQRDTASEWHRHASAWASLFAQHGFELAESRNATLFGCRSWSIVMTFKPITVSQV